MFYQESKSMKSAVIGTIMPWSGALSEIPPGWIICDGTTKQAKQFPLLVQVIGDTYNTTGIAGTLGGAFPNYLGEFWLPNLTDGEALMDLEPEYFATKASGGTGNPIDTDPDARNLIEPFIGEIRGESVQSVFTDVRTDVVFTLNENTGYQGVIKGNSIIDGIGERVIYVGGRKLGHTHIIGHTHSGSYETINGQPGGSPGGGVIPWDNVQLDWKMASHDVETDGVADDPPSLDTFDVAYMLSWEGLLMPSEGNAVERWAVAEAHMTNRSGFGGGQGGRTVGQVNCEAPPVNIIPRSLARTPIANLNQWNVGPDNPAQGRLVSEGTVEYAADGGQLQIPFGQQNYYTEYDPMVISPAPAYFGTLLSNPGDDWQETEDVAVFAHSHDPFVVTYAQGSLKPISRLYPTVNIPINTDLDNTTNQGAFQIDMNTSQPSLTCIYIIRAY